jgi:hypothetical protein
VGHRRPTVAPRRTWPRAVSPVGGRIHEACSTARATGPAAPSSMGSASKWSSISSPGLSRSPPRDPLEMGNSDTPVALINRALGPKTGPKAPRRPADVRVAKPPEAAPLQVLRVELAGLEPATSWVRSRRSRGVSLACLQGMSLLPRGREASRICPQFAGDRGSSITRKARSDENHWALAAAIRR